MVAELKAEIGDYFVTLNMFQPLPAVFGAHGNANGGNVLGLGRMAGTHVLWLAGLHVRGDDRGQVRAARAKASAWAEGVEAYAKSLDLDGEYLYLNYADSVSQDPLSSYGEENLAKIAAAARKYDPDGVFQYRVPGGYKISKSYAGYADSGAGDEGSEDGHDEL